MECVRNESVRVHVFCYNVPYNFGFGKSILASPICNRIAKILYKLMFSLDIDDDKLIWFWWHWMMLSLRHKALKIIKEYNTTTYPGLALSSLQKIITFDIVFLSIFKVGKKCTSRHLMPRERVSLLPYTGLQYTFLYYLHKHIPDLWISKLFILLTSTYTTILSSINVQNIQISHTRQTKTRNHNL